MNHTNPPQKIFSFKTCPKKYRLDQDKACTPEETLARFQARLQASGLDLLKNIERIDTGRLDIPVYFSLCGPEARRVIGNKKQMGKGSSPVQARASACMELAERFSFFSFLERKQSFFLGDYEQAEALGHPIMSLQALLASVQDHRLRPELLRSLLQSLPLRWVWAVDLGDERARLVPLSWFYAINEFNGSSAGNTPEEAVLQGLCEVVERHVCALISGGNLPCPRIDPHSLRDPVARELVQKFTQNGIELRLHDFSLNTGIPTVAALAWDPRTYPERSEIVYTAGTAPEPEKALIRALTEVAQLAGDFHTKANYLASGLPKPSRLEEVDYLFAESGCIAIQQMANLEDADLLQELRRCIQALRSAGMEAMSVDITHPGLAIPAAYTIIPGAQFRERAMAGNAALFAAKLAAELLTGAALEQKLAQMQRLLPNEYALFFYRGRHLYEQGDPASALSYFKQALAGRCAQEDAPYLYSYMGCCLRDLGRFDEAMQALHQGLEQDEQRPDIYNALGVCAYKKGLHQEAAAYFRRALELNPASAIDYANLALNLERLGDIEAAIANYQIALSQDAAIGFAQEHLAALMAR